MSKTINEKWLTQPTGDPFVDIGGYVIEYLLENIYKGDTIEQLIDRVTKIYVNHWDAKLNTFFLNSKITQPAFKGSRKIEEANKYFNSLLTNTEPNEIGYCRITGQKTNLFDAGRDNSIMSGSRTFINFHHSFDKGLKLSKEVLIRLHFVPFGSELLSGKVALIKSSKPLITKLFVHKNIKNNLQNFATGLKSGVSKSEFKNPANALFDFVKYVVKESNEELKKGASITLYHFTNFGARPEIDVYKLPSNVFLFYCACFNYAYHADWQNFVRSHYKNSKFSNAKFDTDDGVFEFTKKGQAEVIAYNDYKTWYNTIYHKLLEGETLLPNFRNWSKENKLHFDIIRLYQQIAQNMKKETIDKILQIADFIIKGRSEDGIKKIITRLDKATNGSQIRRVLLSLVKENYNKNSDKNQALISVEEYTEYLFPDTANAREIRDLLLIAIYQKLHESNVKVKLEEQEKPLTVNE